MVSIHVIRHSNWMPILISFEISSNIISRQQSAWTKRNNVRVNGRRHRIIRRNEQNKCEHSHLFFSKSKWNLGPHHQLLLVLEAKKKRRENNENIRMCVYFVCLLVNVSKMCRMSKQDSWKWLHIHPLFCWLSGTSNRWRASQAQHTIHRIVRSFSLRRTNVEKIVCWKKKTHAHTHDIFKCSCVSIWKWFEIQTLHVKNDSLS